MKSAIIFLFLLASLPLISASTTDIVLKFQPSSSPQSFTVYKGSYIDIPVTVRSTDSVSINCKISSSLGEQNIQLNTGSQQTITFKKTAPSKIKNLQPESMTFTTSCTGPPSYACGLLWLDTCRYVSTPFPHSVTVSYDLTPQDKQNLLTIEGYTKQLSSGITTTDSTLKTLKDLIDKTPILLKPSNSIDSYNVYQNNFNTIKEKFNNAIGYIEQETYEYASVYTSPTQDLNILNEINSNAATLTNQINANIQDYKEIVTNFNTYTSESGNLIKSYSTKSNSDIIDEYNSLTSSTKNKLETYQFESLLEAQNTVENYKNSYNKFLNQLKARESDVLVKGIAVLKNEFNALCKNNSLCSTQNKINLEVSLNLQQLCEGFKSESQEADDYNEKIYTKYKPVLVKLSYNATAMNKKDQIAIIQSIIQNVTMESTKIEKEVSNSVKKANRDGKTIDVINYSSLVEQFNNGDLVDKKNLVNKLEVERDKINAESDNLLASQNSFVLFFKRIYYFAFGSSQPITTLSNDKSESLIITSDDFNNFFSNSCKSFGTINSDTANAPNIAIVNQQSDVKTEAINPTKTCMDENGQRTTNCCNDDSYKSRTDLYPVIFVHGHASENGQKTVQSSLDTFTNMNSYFAQNGYIVKDILYPEKATELTKGIWGYCKPVALRVTYYEGIINSSSVQYKPTIGGYAPTLSKQIDAVLTATNKDKAIIISHSMGGIISRYYIKNDEGKSKVFKLITISSPHYGTNSWATMLSGTPFAELESKELKPTSDFLKALNNPSDSLVDTWSIMGDSKACDLGLGERCDGIIYVNGSKLKNGKDFIIFKGTQYEHSLIVNQNDVAQKVLEIVKK
ncbi:MAG: hypothetical protein Q7R87_01975 [Nanoarchaeota archaeon]|nr:hypothetical protein [Nanoarchaeota archaeon]